jgi:DNA topoisomerase III
VVNNLAQCSIDATDLVIWTDCDREGEAIGFDIINVCQAQKPGLDVYRAHFSTLTREDLERAAMNLVRPNKNLADAVNVRQEVDLRIGASFTRFQTLLL